MNIRLTHILCWVIFTLTSFSVIGQNPLFQEEFNIIDDVSGTNIFPRACSDIDGDGVDDVIRVSKLGLTISRFNSGQWENSFYPVELENLPDWSICVGDLDNDYQNELVMAGQFGVSVLKYYPENDSFNEIKLSQPIYSQRAVLSDINNDGWLDLLVCNETGKSQVYLNDRTGNLEYNETALPLSALPGNYSVCFSDLDNDGNPDFYISKCYASAGPGNPIRTNLFYRNLGNGNYQEMGSTAGIADNAQSWTSLIEDFDHDGDMDIFVINHDQGNRLYKNNGFGQFTDVIDQSGIDKNDFGATEALALDVDNDGNLDIFSNLSQSLYLGKGDLTFSPYVIPFKAGALGDFNNDGYPDAIVQSHLWINKGGSNHFIKLGLKGSISNYNGIGSKVIVYTKEKTQTRELRAGNGYSTMNPLNLVFGLGQDSLVDSIKVQWPSGLTTSIYQVSANQFLFIPESNCISPQQTLISTNKTQLCKNDSTEIFFVSDPANNWIWSTKETTASIWTQRAGHYFVITTDTVGCQSISNYIEIRKEKSMQPEIFINSFSYPDCEGSPISLQALTNDFYEIEWNDGTIALPNLIIEEERPVFYSLKSLCSEDRMVSDTLHLEFNEVPEPPSYEIQEIDNTIKLTATGNHCLWYNNNGELIASDSCHLLIDKEEILDSYSVQSYHIYPGHVSYHGLNDTAGIKLNNTLEKSVKFTIFNPSVLHSIDLYLLPLHPPGLRIIYLLDQNHLPLDSTWVHYVTGKNTIQLNYALNPGSYWLSCNVHAQLSLAGNIDYPFSLGLFGVLETSNLGDQVYPYFFNWAMTAPSDTCYSEPTVIPIEVNKTDQIHLANNQTSVFPNPASDFVTIIDKAQKIQSLMLFDVWGRCISVVENIDKNYGSINNLTCPNGSYYVKVVGEKKIYFLPVHIFRW